MMVHNETAASVEIAIDLAEKKFLNFNASETNLPQEFCGDSEPLLAISFSRKCAGYCGSMSSSILVPAARGTHVGLSVKPGFTRR